MLYHQICLLYTLSCEAPSHSPPCLHLKRMSLFFPPFEKKSKGKLNTFHVLTWSSIVKHIVPGLEVYKLKAVNQGRAVTGSISLLSHSLLLHTDVPPGVRGAPFITLTGSSTIWSPTHSAQYRQQTMWPLHQSPNTTVLIQTKSSTVVIPQC